jgi:ribonuclease P protein component
MRNKLVLLKSESDFDKNRFRKTFNSATFRIRVASGNQNTPRFGFIIPAKVVGKVVDRNKIKRRMKSALRDFLPNIKNFDIIYFPGQKVLKKQYQDLRAEIEFNLKQSRLWKE